MYIKMFVRATCLAFMLIAVSGEVAEDSTAAGFRTVLRAYDECNKSVGGFTPCLKKKAINFIDRLSKIGKLPIGEGLYVVKTSEMDVKAVTDNELESSLPRGLEERDEALTSMLMNRIIAFFNSRTIQVNFPKMDSEQLGRGLEEGRGKMKKMMGMMGMGFAMKMAAMVPIAIAGLFMLAGKALITAKIALLLSGIIAIKKLISQKNQHHESHGWSSGGGGGSGGWDRRSIAQADAQKLAYSSYLPK